MISSALCRGVSWNLKAISSLLEGQSIDSVISKLKGITCGIKKTFCADQLAQAIEEAMKTGN